MTVPQVRVLFSRLLFDMATTLSEIAEDVSRTLRRTEETRIYQWYKKTGTFPPRRCCHGG